MISSILVVALTSLVFLCRAQFVQSSFEEPLSPTWKGPEGGGSSGGGGGGCIVSRSSNEFVRTGKQAVRLVIWDDGSPESVSWAGLMKIAKCSAGRKVHVGAWVFFSSDILPMDSGCASAQLKVEYFQDESAEELIPTHIYLSAPFSPDSLEANKWHLLEAVDRAPQHARSMKFSVVVTGQKLGRR